MRVCDWCIKEGVTTPLGDDWPYSICEPCRSSILEELDRLYGRATTVRGEDLAVKEVR